MSFPCQILGGFPYCDGENTHPTWLQAAQLHWGGKYLSQISFFPLKEEMSSKSC